ncbi:MAG: hypothetical protein FWH21_00415, partial [Kiritimatiellaeota bacterium]|nr:hypothetical protein [Kiritimatiellota bacterium]
PPESPGLRAVGGPLYPPLPDKWAHEPPAARNVGAPPPPPPSSVNPVVDARLDAIVARALCFKREERYHDASEMLADLETWTSAPPKNAKDMADGTVSSKHLSADPLVESQPLSQGSAEKLVEEAFALADQDRLDDAADRMEEAWRMWPALKEHYALEVQAWRNGINTR